ncbi:hypothetical protein [uncultured Cyclobacterium sp.]|uniref:hypothetical protein n=1 Tax=uncultured Cyclobacterium sp. TaxID=453820 RepID=UPI0030ED87B8
MKLNRKNKGLMRQRLTLLIVMLFCVFVSSSEIVVSLDSQDRALEVKLDLNSTNDEGPAEDNQTFIHSNIDAVVPFVLYAFDFIYNFIYEIIVAALPQTNFLLGTELEYNQLFKILFEQIISVNAP